MGVKCPFCESRETKAISNGKEFLCENCGYITPQESEKPNTDDES
jgi:predicted RNA-binding Zn-ribbon protein involved in translation (DUF1610 family)